MKRPNAFERFKVYTWFRKLYDKILRPNLPEKIGVYNGVAVRDRALLDLTDEQPDYEGSLIEAIRSTVKTSDECVVVGGGRGVSGVVTANAVGPTGSVHIYEGGAEQCELVNETVELAQVSDWTRTNHAIVSEGIDVYGDTGGATRVEPNELPKCNVLILDCEGAEIDIIRSIDQQPETIVVETHGIFDSPEADVREVLSEAEYDVVDKRTEYEDRGIHVLTARLHPTS